MAPTERSISVALLPYTATTKYGAALETVVQQCYGFVWDANRSPNRVTTALYQPSGGLLRSTYTVCQK